MKRQLKHIRRIEEKVEKQNRTENKEYGVSNIKRLKSTIFFPVEDLQKMSYREETILEIENAMSYRGRLGETTKRTTRVDN